MPAIPDPVSTAADERRLWIFETCNITDARMQEFPSDKVFVRVCHVKQGYEDRERHILKEFGRRGVPVHFFLDWDIADITKETRASFVGSDKLRPSEVSLALKQVGIWREFLETDKLFCLVFEDDVFLDADFVGKLGECIAEFGSPDRKAVVYLGSGSNYYVPRWKLRKGQKLYPGLHARCADSYLITRPVAKARLDWLAEHRLSKPIDHQIEHIDEKLGIEMLWFERPIVEQGSQNGAFQSSVAGSARHLWLKRITWSWKKASRRFFGHNARGKSNSRKSA
ncbi:glycosyltransferase family 25 protein [Mesorhizobium amorphae]|uniref:glycosyltransferase family 25 protein n=1 Tax=Mesorhizobium amorphae TaxID=71433 RepID=UPI001FEF5831|nr:hypothetical protein [Mesorhizobium amorphae]